MFVFSTTMALFWTFSELLCLFFFRRGILEAEGKNTSRPVFTAGCIAFFLLLVVLSAFGEWALGRFVDLSTGFYKQFYRLALWNLFCTVWVSLEAVIFVYVIDIYRRLRSIRSSPAISNIRSGLWIAAVLPAFISLFFFYELAVYFTMMDYGLSIASLKTISFFYVRMCGVFWILFEGGVAFTGMRIYRIISKEAAPPG